MIRAHLIAAFCLLISACTPAPAAALPVVIAGELPMSFHLSIDLADLQQVADKLHRISELDEAELLDAIGFEVENQTRDRLSNEKASPDGQPWEPWSARYAKTRHGGHSLLENEGDLIDSIEHQVNGRSVEIGSNFPHAARQNFGDDDSDGGIPAREYLGISEENGEDIIAVVLDFYREELARLT